VGRRPRGHLDPRSAKAVARAECAGGRESGLGLLDRQLVHQVWTGAGALALSREILHRERSEAAGSDVDVTPLSPWWGLWAAVVRKELQTGQVLVPEELITIQEALSLYRRNGAYAGFNEHETGSLELGKQADFIVVDRDDLTIPSDGLKDVVVLETWVGGQKIFENPH
jgi:predicted amidohydrolase YtcJ